MPITTPESLVIAHNNDTDHFSHVMEHLFEPAITKAGFTPRRSLRIAALKSPGLIFADQEVMLINEVEQGYTVAVLMVSISER